MSSLQTRFLLPLLWLCACEAADRPPTAPVDGTGRTPPVLGNENGQTGSPGDVECNTDADCRSAAEAAVQALAEPGAARTFEGAHCGALTSMVDGVSVSGPSCMCHTGSGYVPIGPEGGGCYVRGRVGDCLFDDDDFAGCREDDTCASACDELAARSAKDAARTFAADVSYARCTQNSCRSVVEVEGWCHPLHAITDGSAYDCALGGETILEQHAATHGAPEQPSTVGDDPSSLYMLGTKGFVQVGIAQEHWGAYAAPTHAYVEAQFFDVQRAAQRLGAQLDVDTCVLYGSAPTNDGGEHTFLDVDVATLTLAGMDVKLDEADVGFSSYGKTLAEPPAPGDTLRFVAQGGDLTSPVDVPLRMPSALSVSSLSGVRSVPPDALALDWTGTNDQPLLLQLWVEDKLSDGGNRARVECLLEDDGAFTVPAEIMSALPAGSMEARFTRSQRSVEESGSLSLLTLGTVSAIHRFALAPVAADPAVREACLAYQAQLVGVYSACAVLAVPNQAITCPDYLAETSGACASYFTCRSQYTRCTAQGISSTSTCRCD